MSIRSPARYVAPLALVVVAIALIVVISSSGDGGSSSTSTTVPRKGTRGTSTTAPGTSTTPAVRRRYTVKPGDNLSQIADRTGVPVQTIQQLNPDVDPQALTPGTRLKLRP